MRPSHPSAGDEIILVLAPIGRDAVLAAQALAKAEFTSKICADMLELAQCIEAGAGAALIAEEALTRTNIGSLKEILRRQPAWSDFPFLVFTYSCDLSQPRQEADAMLNQLGNITVLERPVRFQTMLSAIKSVMRARHRQYEVRDLVQQIKTLNDVLEERVEHRTAALQEANQQMEAFAYSISHDLRAPLRAINSFSEILLSNHTQKMDAEGKDYLRRILRSAKYMDALTQDLLLYSRLSRGEFPIEPIPLDGVVATAVHQLSEDIRTRNAEVIVERSLPTVVGHAAPLEQIISNLLSNALKFSKASGPIKIRVRAKTGNGLARIYVEDNGIGIPPEYHERIFRMFERLGSPNSYPGTGMGLAIVKKAVERLGGTLGVESGHNKGSHFWFELPQAPLEEPTEEQELASTPQSSHLQLP